MQIRDQIQTYIINNTLLPGMRLPPVRNLAQQLGASNQITVAKALGNLADAKLIEGRRGGGSFIRAQSAIPAMGQQTSGPLFAERLFELARAPGVVSFTSNYPVPIPRRSAPSDPHSWRLPSTRFLTVSCTTLLSGAPICASRSELSYSQKGSRSTIDNIMVTSGAQQTIDLSIRALLDPGKAIIIEQPAYYGTLNAARALHVRVLEAPLEPDGMNLATMKLKKVCGGSAQW